MVSQTRCHFECEWRTQQVWHTSRGRKTGGLADTFKLNVWGTSSWVNELGVQFAVWWNETECIFHKVASLGRGGGAGTTWQWWAWELGLVVKIWLRYPHPQLEFMGSRPTSGSPWQLPANADGGRPCRWLRRLDSCHACGRSSSSS